VVADPSIALVRALLDVEGADARVNDAVRSGDAAAVRHAAVGELLIDSRVEFRLAGAGVLEGRADGAVAIVGIRRAADLCRRIARIGDEWHRAARPRIGLGREIPGRKPVGAAIVDDAGDAGVAGEVAGRTIAGARRGVPPE